MSWGCSLPLMRLGLAVAPSPARAQLPSLDLLEQASRDSFPASNSPAWTGTVVG
jgi:hypothetical protein